MWEQMLIPGMMLLFVAMALVMDAILVMCVIHAWRYSGNVAEERELLAMIPTGGMQREEPALSIHKA